MNNSWTVRPCTETDLEAIDAIRTAAFQPVFASFRTIVGADIAAVALADAEQEQREHLETLLAAESGSDIYVVEQESQVVAFFAVTVNHQTKVGELDLNAVHPDHQGCGIGTWMYGKALEIMTEAGMTVATVGTGGDASHEPARRAYEKAGFGPSIPSVYYYKKL